MASPPADMLVSEAGVVADRQAADRARGADVLLEQRRRDLEHAGDVVEAVALVVGRQQFGDVDVEMKKVAYRVAVLRAVETVYRLVTRIRLADRLPIERVLERRGECLERRVIGTRHALRRHHPAAQLEHHLLPRFRARRGVVRVETGQRQAAGLQAIAVAGDAVLLDQRTRRHGAGRRRF
jgi:hypothetical protein